MNVGRWPQRSPHLTTPTSHRAHHSNVDALPARSPCAGLGGCAGPRHGNPSISQPLPRRGERAEAPPRTPRAQWTPGGDGHSHPAERPVIPPCSTRAPPYFLFFLSPRLRSEPQAGSALPRTLLPRDPPRLGGLGAPAVPPHPTVGGRYSPGRPLRAVLWARGDSQAGCARPYFVHGQLCVR